ncbi:MAG: hypothetical protein WBG18_17440 [Xanthobacteraceae bacterium]
MSEQTKKKIDVESNEPEVEKVNETPATEPNKAAPDQFDVAKLRLDQSFVESAGVKKLLTTVPVRKPHKQEWVRVHPDPAYRDAFAVIEWKEDREFYILTPSVALALPGECEMVRLFTTINRQGVLTLWPVKLPGTDGRTIRWHTSAAEAVEHAMSYWTKVGANMGLGAYEWAPAPGVIPEPVWPELSFADILRIAFKDRYVSDLNHPVIKRMHGF